MEIYRRAHEIPWAEITDQNLRATLFHLVCAAAETFGGWSSIEDLLLNLFPENEVVWEINFRVTTNLGKNFRRFIENVINELARKTVEDLEATPGEKTPRGYPIPFDRKIGATYNLDLFDERVEQIQGTSPWARDGGELPYHLWDPLTRRWLTTWAIRDTRNDFVPALQKLARSEGRDSKYAQMILGLYLCPICKKEVEGQQNPNTEESRSPCEACLSEAEEGEEWCDACRKFVVFDDDGMPNCDCA